MSRERILRTAIDLADRDGIEAVSMRRIAHELGVVPMALYKHVANKEEILDGLVELVIGEIDPVSSDDDWKTAVRTRILSARRALLRHPWAARVIETRTEPGPAMLAYMDSMIGLFLAAGFSIDLTHHALHALGNRLLGYTQELFDDSEDVEPDAEAARWAELADTYPHIHRITLSVTHDDASVVGGRGCDDQLEFEFALDLMLDGLERIKAGT
ncbi:MAG TPA: TetR/AcrR family transcriptional regulator [Actinomycetota bacterium]|nr:TetR/AcrR family transcriptional regulator [Actinomycetota bacterium]